MTDSPTAPELLLLSNSRNSGQEYLAHVSGVLEEFASGLHAVFLPFAAVTIEWDAYAARVEGALREHRIDTTALHRCKNPLESVAQADLIVVGGGNTFHLLKECRTRGLLSAISSRMREGGRYLGWSAGANLACPTIRTTNDMPIVDPGGFDALHLIDFQINPHYTNALPEGHQGETRNERIGEFIAANPAVRVLGLPEGDWVRVSQARAVIGGAFDAPLFASGQEVRWIQPGQPVS